MSLLRVRIASQKMRTAPSDQGPLRVQAACSMLAFSATAFSPPASTHVHTSVARSTATRMLADESRRAVLAAMLGAGIGSFAQPSFAGYVTSLGIETTKPSDADVDKELLNSKAVQTGLENIKGYKSAASSLKGKFESDPNMPLIPSIRKDFDFSKVSHRRCGAACRVGELERRGVQRDPGVGSAQVGCSVRAASRVSRRVSCARVGSELPTSVGPDQNFCLQCQSTVACAGRGGRGTSLATII